MAFPTRIATCIALVVLTPALLLAAADAGDVPGKVNFAEHVAPILHENCVGCHRPGDIAPMSLLTYEETRPWAKSIRKAVSEGTMPPWHADPAYGHWANARALTDVERDTLVRWVKQGAPAGDLDQAPAPPEFEEGWRYGEPDLVVQFDEVSLPADGPDVFKDLAAAYELEEDRWIEAVEILPGDRQVVHHVIIYLIEEGKGSPNGWLGAWAAGMEPMVFPEGTGRLIKKGSRLVADMHYHPNGEAANDATRIGLHFADTPPEKELVNLWIQNAAFEIPAGDENHEVKASYRFPQDSVVHALLPHMHYRGKDFTYTAVYPDGRKEVLLRVPDYDFNWQTIYLLDEPLDMPAGSRIDCVAHFDNSTNNPDNPDPTRNVTFGNESYDEMMIGFVDYTVKEGLRPRSAEERLQDRLRELLGERRGEVFAVDLREVEDDESGETGLVLPGDDGTGGLWLLVVNGELYETEIRDWQRDGDKYTGRIVAPFGAFPFRGTGSPEGGKVEGEVLMGDKVFLVFEGELAGKADA